MLNQLLLGASEISANLYCNSRTVLGRLRDYLRLLMRRALPVPAEGGRAEGGRPFPALNRLRAADPGRDLKYNTFRIICRSRGT